jgi:hypothetical protein
MLQTRPLPPSPSLDQAVFDAAMQRATELRSRALDDAVQALWRRLRPAPAAAPALQARPCRA